jgi:hypothetical protein
LEAQSQNLIATHRLQKTSQGLGMKAVGHDSQFSDRTLKLKHLKQAQPSHHGQSIECMVPEFIIVGESFERFQKETGLDGWVGLPERCLQLLYKIAKPDWVLLVVGMGSVGRLVKRKTRRLAIRYQVGYQFVCEQSSLQCHFCLLFRDSKRLNKVTDNGSLSLDAPYGRRM